MANVELNALSVITCGSFSARIFLPEMEKLHLDDEKHVVKYPVLWLLHSDGQAAVDWMRSPAEYLSAEYGIVIIAPDQHHALTTNMEFGPRYEEFLRKELPGICQNILPISDDPSQNWIAGTGTGGYGAVKMALKYPDVFSKAVAMNGILDMERAIREVQADRDPGFPHNLASLEAVFGDLSKFRGSENDLYALAQKGSQSSFLFTWEEGFPYAAENERLAQKLGAQTSQLPVGSDLDSNQQTLRGALAWLTADNGA